MFQSLSRDAACSDICVMPSEQIQRCFNPSVGMLPVLTLVIDTRPLMKSVFQSLSRDAACSDVARHSRQRQICRRFNPSVGMLPVLTAR